MVGKGKNWSLLDTNNGLFPHLGPGSTKESTIKKFFKLYTWFVYFPICILHSYNKFKVFSKDPYSSESNSNIHNDSRLNISLGKSFGNIPAFNEEHKQFPM